MAALALWLPSPALQAAKIVLRIQAGNPLNAPQTVKIRSNLPAGVSTNHILDLAGLDLGYDVKSGTYYVHKEVELSGKEIAIYDVSIDDIWSVDADVLAELEAHTESLLGKLENEDSFASAESLRVRVQEDLARIRRLQKENAIGSGKRAIDHIRAHESNMETLKSVRIDVGRMENLVMSAGKDPGVLHGTDTATAKLDSRDQYEIDENKTAIIRIAVRNTSRTAKRSVQLRRPLPPEVRMDDVLDSGGLDVGRDSQTGETYLFSERLELEPEERMEFTVTIRDRWNVNAPRIQAMMDSATNMLAKIEALGAFEGLEESLGAVVSELDQIGNEDGPTVVNRQYVAFYRDQAQRLDAAELKLSRIRNALPRLDQSAKLAFKVKPPSPKTTWLIIYTIIGFLGAFSLVFFLRSQNRGQNAEAESGEE